MWVPVYTSLLGQCRGGSPLVANWGPQSEVVEEICEYWGASAFMLNAAPIHALPLVFTEDALKGQVLHRNEDRVGFQTWGREGTLTL